MGNSVLDEVFISENPKSIEDKNVKIITNISGALSAIGIVDFAYLVSEGFQKLSEDQKAQAYLEVIMNSYRTELEAVSPIGLHGYLLGLGAFGLTGLSVTALYKIGKYTHSKIKDIIKTKNSI